VKVYRRFAGSGWGHQGGRGFSCSRPREISRSHERLFDLTVQVVRPILALRIGLPFGAMTLQNRNSMVALETSARHLGSLRD
jgi:hypothetical protein